MALMEHLLFDVKNAHKRYAHRHYGQRLSNRVASSYGKRNCGNKVKE